MCTKEIRAWRGVGADRRFREPIGQSQISQPDGATCCLEEQLGVGRQVGIKTQRGAAHHAAHVVAVGGRGQFGGNLSAQPTQPGFG